MNNWRNPRCKDQSWRCYRVEISCCTVELGFRTDAGSPFWRGYILAHSVHTWLSGVRPQISVSSRLCHPDTFWLSGHLILVRLSPGHLFSRCPFWHLLVVKFLDLPLGYTSGVPLVFSTDHDIWLTSLSVLPEGCHLPDMRWIPPGCVVAVAHCS